MVDLPERNGHRAREAWVGAAEERDGIAAARDAAADERDRRAENRDHVASARDRAADERDRAACANAELIAASHDRKGAGHDRAEAAGDRHAASVDRGASAGDRAAASLDELTGAHRRGAGFVELEREMARVRRTRQSLVLAFVDVNGLKAVNDTRGHAAGDRMLREVVATLRTKLRSYDLVIRFGGDEFLCAIPGVSMDEAAERLAAVNTTLAASPERGSVTSGLADLQEHDSFEDLVARADAALYRRRQEHLVVDLTGAAASPPDGGHS
jgi:diguanylate cyclase (GGDEF)-like protein